MATEMTTADMSQQSTEVSVITAGGQIIGSYVITLECIISAVGIVTNLLVVIVMFSDVTMLKSRINIYVTSQSCIDVMVAIFTLLQRYITDDGRQHQGAWGHVVCTYWLSRFPYWSVVGASSYNMVAMTTERYISIVKPVWHKLHVTRRVVWGSIIISVLLGIGFQLIMKAPFSRVKDGACLLHQYPNPTVGGAFSLASLGFYYLIPVCVILGTYSHMSVTLRGRVAPVTAPGGSTNTALEGSSNTAPGGSTVTTRKPQFAHARDNVIKTMILVITAYVICWTPSQIAFFLLTVGLGGVDRTAGYYSLIRLLIVLNSAVNPLIYAAKYRAFQGALGKLLLRLTRGRIGWQGHKTQGSRSSTSRSKRTNLKTHDTCS